MKSKEYVAPDNRSIRVYGPDEEGYYYAYNPEAEDGRSGTNETSTGPWGRTPEETILRWVALNPISPQRTVDEIRTEIAKLNGELAALEGAALHIWDGAAGDLQDTPPGGALLHVSWAVSDHSYTMWYPTLEAAKAALLRLARENGCAPNETGLYVDLTSPGCHSSSATIERRAAPVAPESDLDWSRTMPLHLGDDDLILVSRRDWAGLPNRETCVLLQRHVEGDVIAPDGRSFRHHATGSLYSFCKLLLRIPPPWSWSPLPEDSEITASGAS